jgi:hypothetical protein
MNNAHFFTGMNVSIFPRKDNRMPRQNKSNKTIEFWALIAINI